MNEDNKLSIYEGPKFAAVEIVSIPENKKLPVEYKPNTQVLEWFTFNEKLPSGDCEILVKWNYKKATMGPKYIITRPSIAIPIMDFYEKWTYLV